MTFVSFWNLKPLYFILSYSFSFVVPIPVIGCHSLSLVITLVIHCYSLSFVFTRFITRCHSLSRVVIRCTSRCHSLYHSLPFAVTCCTTRCHSFSLDVPLVCLFINDHNNVWKKIGQHILMIFFRSSITQYICLSVCKLLLRFLRFLQNIWKFKCNMWAFLWGTILPELSRGTH